MIQSGSTFSADPNLWDAEFDSSANASLRYYKGSLTRYGEMNPHYDGTSMHARHRIRFQNNGAAFDIKLRVLSFSGYIGSGFSRVVVKINGAVTILSADGDVTITINSGVNDLAVIHRYGRVIDVWCQYLDGEKVFCLEPKCGTMAEGETGGGGGGGVSAGEVL